MLIKTCPKAAETTIPLMFRSFVESLKPSAAPLHVLTDGNSYIISARPAKLGSPKNFMFASPQHSDAGPCLGYLRYLLALAAGVLYTSSDSSHGSVSWKEMTT